MDSIKDLDSNFKTPPYLQKGDTIAIIAPAGILKNKKDVIAKAKALAESWGLKVVYGKHLFTQGNHFAGTDKEPCPVSGSKLCSPDPVYIALLDNPTYNDLDGVAKCASVVTIVIVLCYDTIKSSNLVITLSIRFS